MLPSLERLLLSPFAGYWQRWLLRHHPRGGVTVRLTQKRVYIFLSRSGFVFIVMLLTILGGAINYDLALGYILAFLLGAMAIISIFHTFRNLLGLELTPGRVEAAFVGETARFEILVSNPSELARHHIELSYGEIKDSIDLAGRDSATVTLALPATERGWIKAPRLRLDTHWPIGVFHAWSYAFFEQRALAYPAPEADPPPLPPPVEGSGGGSSLRRGQDDFAGLRPFVPGDSLRRVAWKALSHDDGLMVKQFSGEAAPMLWLDWETLPPGLTTEHRLSRLCAWVLAAHARGLGWGLKLPGRELAPASGEAQLEASLAALALHGIREEA
ncbi:DUF58 domain-containing protein [Chitinimonas lacunae]|uniref:DUF58 domain-containing protein n=1 Tax=Chitinimonas lacunae TaxID=1963018 RepID=A0ABV8MRM6_9NEIS